MCFKIVIVPYFKVNVLLPSFYLIFVFYDLLFFLNLFFFLDFFEKLISTLRCLN